MKVAIVAEYYPRAADPTLGIWAHHQARAARDAGAEVRVIVLHRPVPPLASMRGLRPGSARVALARHSRSDLAAIDRDARRDLGPIPALPVPAARTYLRQLGGVGRTAARPGAAPAARGVSVRPRPRPLRRAGRRRRTPSRSGGPARGLGPRRRRARRSRGRADRQLDVRPRAARCWPTAPAPRGAATTGERGLSGSCISALTRPRHPLRPPQLRRS